MKKIKFMRNEDIGTFITLAIFIAIAISLVYIEYLFFYYLDSIMMITNFIFMMLFVWFCYVIGSKKRTELKKIKEARK